MLGEISHSVFTPQKQTEKPIYDSVYRKYPEAANIQLEKRWREIHGDGLGGGRNRAQLLITIGFFLG